MSSTHVLGPLCKRGHDHDGTGQSLRYASTRQCVACHQKWGEAYRPGYYAATQEHQRAKSKQYYHANRDHYIELMAAYSRTDAGRAARRRSRARNREALNQYSRDWRAANREHVSEYNAAYAAANREQIRQRMRAYGVEHAEEIAERRRLYREGHRDQYLAAQQAYRQSTRGKIRRKLAQTRREERKRKALCMPYTSEELDARFAAFNHACAYCGADTDLTIDHVVPIARGGADAILNLVPACSRCNSSKGDRDIEKWYRQQPYFDNIRYVALTRAMQSLFWVWG